MRSAQLRIYTTPAPPQEPFTACPKGSASRSVVEKLRDKHSVTPDEVYECFLNRNGPSFEDARADHKTDPPTFWFMSETDRGRRLKVVYVEYEEYFAIKTAFEPRDKSEAIYQELCEQNPEC